MPPFWPGLIPWSPLAGGLLGGVLKKMASGRRARPAFARLIKQYRPQLEAYEGLCEDLGETPPMWRWPGSCRILSLPLH